MNCVRRKGTVAGIEPFLGPHREPLNALPVGPPVDLHPKKAPWASHHDNAFGFVVQLGPFFQPIHLLSFLKDLVRFGSMEKNPPWRTAAALYAPRPW